MRTYQITARRKVGRQNIGPMVAWALATGDKAALVAAMRQRFPHARIAGHETGQSVADIEAFHATITASGSRAYASAVRIDDLAE